LRIAEHGPTRGQTVYHSSEPPGSRVFNLSMNDCHR
jgi:hypothetical protein